MINRELLILEKVNNGKPFKIFNNVKDKIDTLKERMLKYGIMLITYNCIVFLFLEGIKNV